MEVDENVLAKCQTILGSDQYEEAISRRRDIQENSTIILTVAPILSLISAVLCLIITLFLIFAVARRRIPSRKYSIVISRSLGDLFSSVLITGASLVARDNTTNSGASFTIIALFLYVSTFGMVQLSLSHILVIVLRQLSLSRPYGFDSSFSLKRLILFICTVWVMSILYAAAFSPLANVILNPKTARNACSYSSCQKPLLVIDICLISFVLLMIIIFYLAVVFKLRKASIKEKMHNEPPVTRKSLWKFLAFGGHIALYVLIASLILAGSVVILHNVWLYNKLKHGAEECRIVDFINTVVRLETVAGGAVLLWVVRIIFDLVILVLSEYRRIVPCFARNQPQILADKQVLSRSHSLRWHRGRNVSCPVFSLEKTFTREDFRN